MRRSTIIAATIALLAALLPGMAGASAQEVAPTSAAEARAAWVTGLSVTPQRRTLSTWTGVYIKAVAALSDGSQSNVTDLATWHSSNTLVARVASAGFVRVRQAGRATITATYRGKVARTYLVVKAGAPTSLVIRPAKATVELGRSVKIVEYGTFPTFTQNLTQWADWTVPSTGIVSYSRGRLTALKGGVATVTGTFKGVTAQTRITVVSTPRAAFTIDHNPASVEQLVSFDGSGSSDPEGSALTYAWSYSFNGGAPVSMGTTSAVQRTFHQPGTYQVSLKVTDAADHLTDVETRTLTVTNAAPTASGTATPNPAWQHTGVAFDASTSTDPETPGSLTYAWDFDNNGTTDATGVTANRVFTTAGAKTVRLTVTDAHNATDTADIAVTVDANNKPVAQIAEPTPNPANAGVEISFDASGSSDTDAAGETGAAVASYAWDFGDGTTSTLVNPTHAYAAAGEHLVSLVVTDNHGVASTPATVTVTITEPPGNAAPTANGTATPNPAIQNNEVTFDASTSTDAETPDSLTYAWDFDNDGIPDATGVTATHVFDTPGTKTVKLTVTDPEGATGTQDIPVTIVSATPTAAFTIDPSPAAVAQSVTFDGTGSTDPEGAALTYQWTYSYEGGAPLALGSTATVQHTFQEAGSYQVTLAVTDADDNLTDTLTKPLTVTNTAPTASGNYLPDPAWQNEQVSFDATASTDAETPGSLTYAWDFDNDGVPDATGETATHTFGTAGTKTVKLTVTDPQGATGTQDIAVTVNSGAPTAAFTMAPNPAGVGQQVTFDGTGSSDPQGESLTHHWTYTLNGGNPADLGTAATFQQAFDGAGTYQVTLAVTDADDNLTDTITKTLTVNNTAPIANGNYGPNPAWQNEQITFDASTSTDAETPASLTYSWDFDNDGIPDATGVTATHTYATAGTKTVKLTVTDPQGATGTKNLSVAVNSGAPTAAFTINPNPANVVQQVTLDGTGSTDPQGAALTHQWTYTLDGGASQELGTGATLQHTFDTAGSYSITLTVTDADDNLTATLTKPLTVTNGDPIADGTFSPDPAWQNEQVTFNASASTDAETPGSLTYGWDFDNNGSTDATGVTATRAFATAGTKTVKLTVTDPQGHTAAKDIVVTVNSGEPTASFTTTPNPAKVAQSVTFDGSGSSDPQAAALTYQWSYVVNGQAPVDLGTAETFQHAFAVAGTYSVTLAVTDADDNITVTDTQTLTVTNTAPTADGTVTPNPAIHDNPVAFDASTSSDAETPGSLTYSWDFDNDGIPDATDVTASHTFEAAGDYIVKLTVTDPQGLTGTKNFTVTVEEPNDTGPTASGTVTPNPAWQYAEVAFDASASSDPQGGSLTYAWDFDGDGSSDASGVQANRTFTTPGDRTVKLTVTNQGGLSGSQDIGVTINPNNRPVAVIAEPSPTPALTTVPVSFNGSGSSDTDADGESGAAIASYAWDFGDGTTSTEPNPTHTYATSDDYVVTLVVTDNHGVTSDPTTVTLRVDPINNTAPTALWTASPSTRWQWATITFNASTSTDAETPGSLTYEWDFESDGSIDATGVSVTKVFETGVDPTVKLTVTDPQGLSGTKSTLVTVRLNNKPVAVIEATPNPVSDGTDVYFNGTGSFDTTTPDDFTVFIASYAWDFGDGTTSTLPQPVHTYAQPGTYTVTLMVTDNHVVTSAVPATTTVTVQPGSRMETALNTGNPNNVTKAELVERARLLLTERTPLAQQLLPGTTAMNWNPFQLGQVVNTYAAGYQQPLLISNKNYVGTGTNRRTIAVAGTTSTSTNRLAYFTANPFVVTTGSPYPMQTDAGMNELNVNTVSWLLGGATLSGSTAKIVLTRMPGASDTNSREWFRSRMPSANVIGLNTCEIPTTGTCMSGVDLLVVGGDGTDTEAPNIAAAVATAYANGAAVLFFGTGTSNKATWEIGQRFGITTDYGSNTGFWEGNGLQASTRADQLPDGTDSFGSGITTILDRNSTTPLAPADYQACIGSGVEGNFTACTATAAITSYVAALSTMRDTITALDRRDATVFDDARTADSDLMRIVVMLADKARTGTAYSLQAGDDAVAIDYPVNMNDGAALSRVLLSDFVTPTASALNQRAADLGTTHCLRPAVQANTCAAPTFPEVGAHSVSLKATTLSEWQATGLTLVPGEATTVTLTNDPGMEVLVRTFYQRQQTTKARMLDGSGKSLYDRPQWMATDWVKVTPGQATTISSPYGGPLYINIAGTTALKGTAVNLDFTHVATHPWVQDMTDQAQLDKFVTDLDKGAYYVDAAGTGFEMHMPASYIKRSLSAPIGVAGRSVSYDAAFGGFTQFMRDVQDSWMFAAYEMAGLQLGTRPLAETVPAEVQTICTNLGLDCLNASLNSRPEIQHINGDLNSTCGGACSGNPLDFSWNNPMPVGWGEVHELGHNLQRNQISISWVDTAQGTNLGRRDVWTNYVQKSGEVSNNIFPANAQWRYFRHTLPARLGTGPDTGRLDVRYAGDLLFSVNQSVGSGVQRNGMLTAYDADCVNRGQFPVGTPTDVAISDSVWNVSDTNMRLAFYLDIPLMVDGKAMKGGTVLTNGWDIWTLIYQAARNWSKDTATSATWTSTAQARYGMSLFPYSGNATYGGGNVGGMTANDFLLIELSHITGYDWRPFFKQHGVQYTSLANQQVTANATAAGGYQSFNNLLPVIADQAPLANLSDTAKVDLTDPATVWPGFDNNADGTPEKVGFHPSTCP